MSINHFFHNIEKSVVVTAIGIILLFAASIAVILVAPNYIDPTWTEPTTPYQVQMYEVSDPNLYIGSSAQGSSELQFVYHLKKDFSLLAFHENPALKIVAPPHLQQYITRHEEKPLKLTSRLLMLRPPVKSKLFDAPAAAEDTRKAYEQQGDAKPNFDVLELYEMDGDEAFANAPVDGVLENWVDGNFVILNETFLQSYHKQPGVIYINNPIEYRIAHFKFGSQEGWRQDPNGEPIKNLEQLRSHPLGFMSRAELIRTGEHIYAIEGCWYCHTDQTRTLVQDVVLNGSAEYPAPPSSANEYIFQHITFPGTRRIGPDLSRTGVKRPSRDWHKGHFWHPKTASVGSIMPSFQHFFDHDPRGGSSVPNGIPNQKFEAMYQYLMTKGTRITPPTQAWWLGKDPVNTKAIIEGRKVMK